MKYQTKRQEIEAFQFDGTQLCYDKAWVQWGENFRECVTFKAHASLECNILAVLMPDNSWCYALPGDYLERRTSQWYVVHKKEPFERDFEPCWRSESGR